MSADGPIAAQPSRRVGLVVVHGVGETEPGYCVNAIVDTLVATHPGYAAADYNEYKRVAEPGISEPPPVFPVVHRFAQHESGTSIEAVELHWADLSSLQPGRLNTLLGLFRVIFESHHLVDAMLDPRRSWTSWLLRKILWIAGWLLRGPIAALTIATSAICALLLFEPVTIGSTFDARWQFLAVQGALFAASLFAFYKIVQRQDYSWYDTAFWLWLTSLALFILAYNDLLLPALDRVWDLKFGTAAAGDAVAIGIDCADPTRAGPCYINGLYKVIIWGWRFWGLLLFVCALFLLFAMAWARRMRDHTGIASLSTSIAILILQFLLWTTVVVTVIYPMLNRAETNSTLTKAGPLIDRALERGEIKPDDPVVKLAQVPNIELEWIQRFKFIYAATAMTVLLFVAAAWYLMEFRKYRARAGLSDLEKTARRMPRLLFNPGLVALLIVAYLVVITLVVLQPLIENKTLFVQLRNYVLPFAALVALVMPFFFGHRIANVVHIARDLIDHHYIPRLETATYFMPSLFRTRYIRPRRARIQNRLKLILNTFLAGQQYDEVVFVAHSQGSVVVYDYLNDAAPAYAEIGGARPSLLTFGSPIGAVYQRYFYEYAARIPAPPGLASRLKCWINLYRVDDYIGGRIYPPEGLTLDNRVMGLGGHTSYWSEPEVADALDAIVRNQIADCARPPPLPRDGPI